MSLITDRLHGIRNRLGQWEADAILVGSPVNRRWLSGFTGSFGWVLISAESARLGTDFRYLEQAAEQAPDFTIVRWQRDKLTETWTEFLSGVTRVLIEAEQITLAEYAEMSQIEGVEWIKRVDAVKRLRSVKSAEEIAKIRAAAAITDHAMGQANRLLKPGKTEKQVAWELEKVMRERGADALAFETIVASGPNGARPHHRPTDRVLQPGDNITIDMGARLDGYHSDMTRAFYLGDEPDDQFNHVYNLVLDAQQHALATLKAGVIAKEVDAAARDTIAAAGHAEHFGHGLGHGVGLEIHELPSLSRTKETVLPVGAVVTVEPGVYLPGWGGVRIEDLVMVTEEGYETLSHCPKMPTVALSAPRAGTDIL